LPIRGVCDSEQEDTGEGTIARVPVGDESARLQPPKYRQLVGEEGKHFCVPDTAKSTARIVRKGKPVQCRFTVTAVVRTAIKDVFIDARCSRVERAVAFFVAMSIAWT